MHEPRWHGEFRKCSDLFTISKTDDGFCCSFNTISLAEGFAKDETFEDSKETEYYSYDSYPVYDYIYQYYNEAYGDSSQYDNNGDESDKETNNIDSDNDEVVEDGEDEDNDEYGQDGDNDEDGDNEIDEDGEYEIVSDTW